MKKISLMILLSLAGLGLASCSGDDSSTRGTNTNAKMNSNANTMNSNQAVVTNSNANMMNSNANMGNSTSSNPTAPEGFMTEAAKGGMAEVELSKPATTKAKDAEIQKFAQKMIEDHTNANTELKQLAGKKNVTLPTELDAAHKAIKDKLAVLSGAEFDKEYVNAMVADHEKAVSLFKSQSESGTDADAKAFAAKTLPKLQMHLDMIKAMQGKMK